MKLVHPDYTFEILLEENRVNRLILENPRLMSEMIMDISEQEMGKEGKWVLSEQGEILRLSNFCEMIFNPFNVSINQKSILNNLYEKMVQEITTSEMLLDWRNINTGFVGILENAISNLEFDLEYNDEVEVKDFLKLVNVRFREEPGSYLERLMEYMEITAEIRKVKMFVLVNITSFFTLDEIQNLYKEAFYKKYFLLLIDSQNISIDAGVEHTIILDKDYCVIEGGVS